MKSPTFWMLLVGVLVAWRVVVGFDESSGSGQVRSGEFDFQVLHSANPVLVSFEAEW